MSKKQETISGIVAEMRRGTRLPGYWRSCDVNEILQYHADRLEAALERETDKLQQQYNECARDYNDAQRARSAANSEIAELKKQIGNGAKMREALSDACFAMFNFLKTQSSGYEEMANALDKAKVALAAPPRNCDMGTVDEQTERFADFARLAFQSEVVRCAMNWAQLPYEEGGAK